MDILDASFCPRLKEHLAGKGWVDMDFVRGNIDAGYSMRVLLPTDKNLRKAEEALQKLGSYPGFDSREFHTNA